MELVNEFIVKVPIEEAWVTLTDVELIAPCLPGAQLQEIEGDTYRGIVKVKVGPILATFKGEATFVERDEVAHKAVLKAKGRETGGKGNADALITAQLYDEGATTRVNVLTDLNITGKVAQFGRGALADVSSKLLAQFVENLETTVLNQPRPAPAAAAAVVVETAAEPVVAVADASAATPTATPSSATPTTPTVRKIDMPEVEPLKLGSVARGAIVKRAAPFAVVAALLFWWLRRR